MAFKIYLSAAAHEHDNPTKCPNSCGENVHCKKYMDLVETRLKELGFDVKRGGKDLVGTAALQTRVKEANSWDADLYYVAHSNAGGGVYSMTMHYPSSDSQKYAEIMHKYRKAAYDGNHKVRARNDLYEINSTSMICLYDELFFHDDSDACKWFHNGGMEKMVEETCQALCEIGKVAYKAPVTENPTTGTLYRVQVGAYSKKENAIAMQEKLKKAGFDAIIKTY